MLASTTTNYTAAALWSKITPDCWRPLTSPLIRCTDLLLWSVYSRHNNSALLGSSTALPNGSPCLRICQRLRIADFLKKKKLAVTSAFFCLSVWIVFYGTFFVSVQQWILALGSSWKYLWEKKIHPMKVLNVLKLSFTILYHGVLLSRWHFLFDFVFFFSFRLALFPHPNNAQKCPIVSVRKKKKSVFACLWIW